MVLFYIECPTRMEQPVMAPHLQAQGTVWEEFSKLEEKNAVLSSEYMLLVHTRFHTQRYNGHTRDFH